MKTETRKEGAFSRLASLLTGGTKPRRPQALMMVLLVVGVMSLAGVVSADNSWHGQPPVTNLTGVVNGGVDIQFGNTWKTDNPINNDNTTANLTLTIDPTTVDMKFARLYVVVYTANNTANWQGTETIKLAHGSSEEILANAQALNLEYDRTIGMNCAPDLSAPFTTTGTGLCRVMSDYVSIFDVKNYITTQKINVSVLTTNVSDRFDGRVKEVKLIYGWNVTSGTGTTTRYWINEGHDPSTSADAGYVGETYFYNVPADNINEVTLYTNDIASANGNYSWSDPTAYIAPTPVASNSYARLNQFSIDSGNVNEGTNTFYYDRASTSSWYKLALAVLKITYTS